MQHQRSYVMLNEQGSLRPQPQRRNAPRYYSDESRGGGCCGGCLSCLCWCFCFLLLVLIALSATAVYFFVIYKPQLPSYSVDSLSIAAFEFDTTDLTLHTRLVAAVSADNPNDMIGITYGSGSRVMVMYRETTLCSGKLPSFYQGHRNKTVMQVVMEGRNSYGSALQQALQQAQRSGRIPINVYVSVPVTLKLGEMDLRQVTVNVLCSLVVDNLSPFKKVGIKSAEYQVNVDF